MFVTWLVMICVAALCGLLFIPGQICRWPLVRCVYCFQVAINYLLVTVLFNGDTQNVKLATFRENVYLQYNMYCRI